MLVFIFLGKRQRRFSLQNQRHCSLISYLSLPLRHKLFPTNQQIYFPPVKPFGNFLPANSIVFGFMHKSPAWLPKWDWESLPGLVRNLRSIYNKGEINVASSESDHNTSNRSHVSFNQTHHFVTLSTHCLRRKRPSQIEFISFMVVTAVWWLYFLIWIKVLFSIDLVWFFFFIYLFIYDFITS